MAVLLMVLGGADGNSDNGGNGGIIESKFVGEWEI
jgi:hypothetical protein